MLGSVVLEVAIGMVFVYLLLSLLCSAIGEYLEGEVQQPGQVPAAGDRAALNQTTPNKGMDLARQFYEHGLVRPLYRTPNKPPSYIPSRTFALALWNIATADAQGGNPATGLTTDLSQIRASVAKLPNPELRTALLTLIDEAGGNLARARRNVEEWYNAMMNRVSGWYKRGPRSSCSSSASWSRPQSTPTASRSRRRSGATARCGARLSRPPSSSWRGRRPIRCRRPPPPTSVTRPRLRNSRRRTATCRRSACRSAG